MTEPKLPAGSPISEGELATIDGVIMALGDVIAEDRPLLTAQQVGAVYEALGDLRAALDHERERADEAELWCARLAVDLECQQGATQYETGVARVLEFVKATHDRMRREDRAWQFACAGILGELKETCGPVALPPHERTIARCRRYEEALRKIADPTSIEPGPDHESVQAFAAEALKEQS